MWSYIKENLALVIFLIIAIIICGADLIKAISVWKNKKTEAVNSAVKKKQDETNLIKTIENLGDQFDGIFEKLNEQDEMFKKINERLDALTESDMHDIKSWIVDQYHKFYIGLGWIDAFSADTIEHRYNDYQKEGGNSYIDQLIERLRSLPMDPPER